MEEKIAIPADFLVDHVNKAIRTLQDQSILQRDTNYVGNALNVIALDGLLGFLKKLQDDGAKIVVSKEFAKTLGFTNDVDS
jgi:hypothetical protein